MTIHKKSIRDTLSISTSLRNRLEFGEFSFRMTCHFKNCFNNNRVKFNYSYFPLPKDYRRDIWLFHAGIKQNETRKSSSICNEHFKSSDIIVYGGKKVIKNCAIPFSSIKCGCVNGKIGKSCAKKLEEFKALEDNTKNAKVVQSPEKETLQKMALSGDYIPLDARDVPQATSTPKPGPSRVREKSPPRKRLREVDSDDEPLSVSVTKTQKSYGKRPKTITAFKSPTETPKETEDDGVCDSTTENDGEKEIAVDLIKEERDDPLDCSDVVIVSTYPNVTPRKKNPTFEDDSVEIIPVLDAEESDDEVVEVPAEASVIIVEDESDKPANVRISSPKKRKKGLKHQNRPFGGGKPIPGGSKNYHPAHQPEQSTKAPSKIRIVRENSSSTQKKPRFIVIDGSNVAFHHSLMKKVFSVEGLEIAIRYFEEKGHEVVAVVPVFRSKLRYSTNPDLLKALNLRGKVIFSPAKNINGYTLSSYDDLLIMQVADKNKGVIISNDNFADLLGQNIAWDTIIGSRVIGFTWFKDQFFLPLDPYGRDGPKINDILYY